MTSPTVHQVHIFLLDMLFMTSPFISVSVARLPWKYDLIDTNKLFVPNLENLANIVGTAGSNLARQAAKRPGEGGGAGGPGEEKRTCPEPLPLFPL